MAYVSPNFKHKRQLLEALRAQTPVDVFQPGLGTIPYKGTVMLEGPHYPAAHTWYAEGKMMGGKLVAAK